VAGIGLTFFAMMGSFFFVGLYLQVVRGYSPMETGALLVPFAVRQMVFAPLSTALSKRFGVKALSTFGTLLAGSTFVAIATWQAGTPVWVVVVTFFLMGVGIGSVMPPAMNVIMSSLPREKAGVGSAVSNTVRQVSAALGLAVLGSIVAGVYRDQVSPAVAGLPGPAKNAASESITGAYGVAAKLPAQAAAPLLDSANAAFIQAMHWAAVGSTIVAVFAAVVAVTWLPRKETPVPAAPAVTEPELVGSRS
jgi:MFS family permease